MLKNYRLGCTPFLFYNIEYFVLWARSEKIGFIAKMCLGMMEHWNVGILKNRVWWNVSCFYMDGTDQIIKSDHHPLLIPNIPFFHHSIIPWII